MKPQLLVELSIRISKLEGNEEFQEIRQAYKNLQKLVLHGGSDEPPRYDEFDLMLFFIAIILPCCFMIYFLAGRFISSKNDLEDKNYKDDDAEDDNVAADDDVNVLTPEILSKLEPPAQITFFPEDPQEQSLISNLPDEILLAILKNVPFFDLSDISLVSKRFYRVSKSARSKITFTVDDYYNPLIHLDQNGFSRKRMLPTPLQIESVFALYSMDVHKLNLSRCLITSREDVMAILRRLQGVKHLELGGNCMKHPTIFTHCFEMLQSQGKLHLKSIDLYIKNLSKSTDITSILAYTEKAYFCYYKLHKEMSLDRLGFVHEMLRIPKSARKIRSLTITVKSFMDDHCQDIGRLAKVIPLIRNVHLVDSKLSLESLNSIAEEIDGCDPDELELEKIVFEGKSYTKEKFVKQFKLKRSS